MATLSYTIMVLSGFQMLHGHMYSWANIAIYCMYSHSVAIHILNVRLCIMWRCISHFRSLYLVQLLTCVHVSDSNLHYQQSTIQTMRCTYWHQLHLVGFKLFVTTSCIRYLGLHVSQVNGKYKSHCSAAVSRTLLQCYSVPPLLKKKKAKEDVP